MRIVGGIWRGRQIEAPRGSDQTRPTTDRTREAVASMILSDRYLTLDGESVLDAFAGSGAMAFELLSRGAAHATLVDSSRPAIRAITQNARTLKAENITSVVAGDVTRLAGTPALKGAPFDVVFLDPPYASRQVPQILTALLEKQLLGADARIVCETANAEDVFGEFEILKERYEVLRASRYGAAQVTVLAVKGEHV